MSESHLSEPDFDALVRRIGAHKITDAVELPDGSIVLRYAKVADVTHLHILPATLPHVGFEQLCQKIDRLIATDLERERLSDRLATVEFALNEAGRSDGQTDEPSLISEASTPTDGLATPSMIYALQSAEDRIMASLHDVVGQIDLSQFIGGDRQTSAKNTALDPTIVEMLTRLDQKLDLFMQRPATKFDLTEQRQSFARFLTAIGTVIARLEKIADQNSAMASTKSGAVETKISELSEQVQILVNNQPAPQIQAVIAGFDRLSAELTDLACRPVPVLDLTHQRESLARFATSMAQVICRLEAVSDKITTVSGPDIQVEVINRMTRIEESVSLSSASQDALTAAVSALAERLAPSALTSPPVPLHSGDRTAAEGANFRMEQYHASQDEFFQDMRFVFAELIATQMKARQEGKIAAA